MKTLIEKIKKEYQSGKSAKEIADSFGCSQNKIRYWMEKGRIKPRSWSEATYCKRNPKGDPFKIANNVDSPKLLLLFFIGIGLYLGEGTRKGKYNVALGNTNPKILRAFLLFLRNICGVAEDRVFAELNIFDDVDQKEVISFWSQSVGISKKQIKYTIVRKSKGGSYKNKSKYGTLTIKICNFKLKQIILDWCEQALQDCICLCSSDG